MTSWHSSAWGKGREQLQAKKKSQKKQRKVKGTVSGLELDEEWSKQEWLPWLVKGTIYVDGKLNLFFHLVWQLLMDEIWKHMLFTLCFQACTLSCYCYSSGDSIVSLGLFHKWIFCMCIQPELSILVAFQFCGTISALISYSTSLPQLQSAGVGIILTVSLSSAAFPLLLLLFKPNSYQHFINEHMQSLPSFLQSPKHTFVTITYWQCVLANIFRSCPTTWTQTILISVAHFKN